MYMYYQCILLPCRFIDNLQIEIREIEISVTCQNDNNKMIHCTNWISGTPYKGHLTTRDTFLVTSPQQRTPLLKGQVCCSCYIEGFHCNYNHYYV